MPPGKINSAIAKLDGNTARTQREHSPDSSNLFSKDNTVGSVGAPTLSEPLHEVFKIYEQGKFFLFLRCFQVFIQIEQGKS